jgi:hypothetical protein
MPFIFPYCHLFYILKGLKVGYFSFINQLFLHNSEFKTSGALLFRSKALLNVRLSLKD